MVLSQPKSRRGDQKINLKNNYLEIWSCHYSLLWKIIEKPKIKMSTNQIQRFWSRLRVGKVLAPHSARPKTVPLIK